MLTVLYKLKRRKPQEYSRQVLYQLMWSQPKTVVAASLGISDVALGKACQRADIPIPPRGYWAKLSAGKMAEPAPLPPRGLGKSNVVRFGDRYGYGSTRDPLEDLPPAPTFEDAIDAVQTIATKALSTAAIPKTLTKPHHSIGLLLQQDEERRKTAEGHAYVWDKPRFDSAPERRRLKIINSLFMAVAQSGFRPDVSGKEANSLGVTIGDTHVSFYVEGRGPRWARRHDESPTPVSDKCPFTVFIDQATSDYPTSWEDAKEHPLENRIREIAIALIVAGEMHYRANELYRHGWLVKRKAQAEEEVRKAEEAARQAARAAELREQKRREDWLFQQAANLRRADEIRALVHRIEFHPEALTSRERLEEWTAWALEQASRIDPLSHPIHALFLPPNSDD